MTCSAFANLNKTWMNFIQFNAIVLDEHTSCAGTPGENPIRRIVNLLQKMQTEVTEEGEKDKDLHEKFLCYCEKNDGAPLFPSPPRRRGGSSYGHQNLSAT